MVAGHIATLFEPSASAASSFVGAGGLKATRKPAAKLRKLLAEMPPRRWPPRRGAISRS